MHYRVQMKINRQLNLFLITLCFPIWGVLAQNENNAALAKKFLNSGNYLKASEIYESLYNKHKSTNYYQGLLDCYLALKQNKEAEDLIKKHAKKYSNNPSILVDYAHVLTLNENENKADKKFKELFNLLEENAKFISATANKLYKYNYLDYAIKAYEIALRDPSKGSYRFQLARIYGQMGDVEKMYDTYLQLIISNKSYLQSVKNTLLRTLSNDPENENNQLLKNLLLIKVQKNPDENLSDLLIWLFIQEKNFEAAFDQEKSMDIRFALDQKKIYDLATICRRNKAYDIAIKCYSYIIELGTSSSYFLEAQMALLTVNKELLEASAEQAVEDWLALEQEYLEGFQKLGKTSYTILLMRDLAQIQAFRLHNFEKASETIQEALQISSASQEDIAHCKLVYADILLLQDEIWDAIIYYSQVDKAYKHDVLGHEAKYRRAKISYYQGDFEWAQAQLDVLKKSTSKLIANNAMELSLLIQDNLNLDTTTTTMELFAHADLFIYQNKLEEAYRTLDTIIIDYQGHSLIDEALFRQYNIKMKQKKFEDAASLLEQIVQFFSYDILADDAKFELAQLYEVYFHDTNKALELYQDLITNHQDSFFLSESRKRYRELSKK